MSKGLEMPVNVLIVLVLAVIILAAILGIFTGIWTPGTQTATEFGDFNSACGRYAAAGCCNDPQPDEATCTDLENKLENNTGEILNPVPTCCRR